MKKHEKSLYYRTVYRRNNVIKEIAFAIFFGVSSYPRLLLEVFIRKNFGERYFSFSSALIMAFFLGLLPIADMVGIRALEDVGLAKHYGVFDFLAHYASWYIFLGAFVKMCIDRRNEIKRLPSVFDFSRFSLSAGEIDPAFINYKPNGKKLSPRTIETIAEPGAWFLAGLGLWVLQQPIAVVIVLASICYSLSYFAAYHQGDNLVMDKLDELIFNQELTKVYVDGLGPDETKGVQMYGRRPADPETRRLLANHFVGDSDVAQVA